MRQQLDVRSICLFLLFAAGEFALMVFRTRHVLPAGAESALTVAAVVAVLWLWNRHGRFRASQRRGFRWRDICALPLLVAAMLAGLTAARSGWPIGAPLFVVALGLAWLAAVALGIVRFQRHPAQDA